MPSRSGVLFLIGLLVTTCGIIIMRSNLLFEFIPPDARLALSRFVDAITWYGANLPRSVLYPSALIIGGLIALAGAVVSGWAVRRLLPDTLAGLSLPLPSPRRDIYAFGALGLAAVCNGLLYWHLVQNQYTHLDILLFVAGLGLVVFAIYRFDKPTMDDRRWTMDDENSHRPSSIVYRPMDVIAAIALGLFAVLINSIELDHWNFAWVGDEGAFFRATKALASDRFENVFGLTSGVYGQHPIMDNIYQSLWMRAFGENVISWRLAEIAVLSASTVLVYLLGVALFGRLPAVTAAIVIAANNYLMAFTRIGYNNTHVVFYATLAMLMLVLAWRTQRAVFVFATGAAMGFCLYTFMTALLIWPIIALLLLVIFFRRPTWSQIWAGALMLVGFALVVIPGLLTTPLNKYSQMALSNAVHTQDIVKDPGLSARIGLADSMLSFWYDSPAWRHHFVAGPLVDVVTGALFAVGLLIALFRIHKRAERLVFVWFAIGIVLIAFTIFYSPGAHLTRLHLLMPAVALLSGITMSALSNALTSGLRLPTWAVRLELAVLLALVPVLNLHQLLVQGPAVLARTPEVMLMKVIQENPDHLIVEVGTDPVPRDETSIMMEEYPWLAGRYSYFNLDEFARTSQASREVQIVYVVRNYQVIAQGIVSRLPRGYAPGRETDPSGIVTIWLFKK